MTIVSACFSLFFLTEYYLTIQNHPKPAKTYQPNACDAMAMLRTIPWHCASLLTALLCSIRLKDSSRGKAARSSRSTKKKCKCVGVRKKRGRPRLAQLASEARFMARLETNAVKG